MTRSTLVLACMVALSCPAAAGSQDSDAAEIIQRYLKMPHPKDHRVGEGRMARAQILAELKAMPQEAVGAIRHALSEVKDPRQRCELIEVFERSFQNKESAALLSELLNDPDERVRWQAISGLWIMAMRTDRVGPKRIPLGPDFPPKVEGLVPSLISAANDRAEDNRVSALFALAGTRDPQAVSELRNRLKDPSEEVRFHAACLLTEFQDASGLPEMKKALARLHRDEYADLLRRFIGYSDAQRLLASFERITGKSFGEIPWKSPSLCSEPGESQEIQKRLDSLLDAWVRWWAWEPKAGEN
jgi:hypothetical protein